MNKLEQHRPRFSRSQAKELAHDLFGISGTTEILPSERDQNILLVTQTGQKFVLKIANSGENRETLRFQNQAMDHLSRNVDPDLFPQVRLDRHGEQIGLVTSADGRRFQVRMLSHLSGQPLARFTPHTEQLFHEMGCFLGKMDKALNSFDWVSPQQGLLWDLDMAASVIKQHFEYVVEPQKRALVGRFLNLFETVAAPRLSQLRTSIIHNDANDHNILVSAEGQIAGIIDFGDMHHSYTVYELAIALAYGMLDKLDPFSLGAHIVAGYNEQLPLTDLEIELLFPMIAARLCASVSLSSERRLQAPENEYLRVTERPAWRLLEQLEEIGPNFANYLFRHACHKTPCPQSQTITRWLKKRAGQLAPILSTDLTRVSLFDLSVGSLELGQFDLLPDVSSLTAKLFGQLRAAGANVGIGPYNETRLIYQSDAFRVATDAGEERRTVHLGIDLFVQPGTLVHAPLDGVVHSLGDNAAPLDYGPTIILQHQAEGVTFYTLYGHLSRQSLDGLRPGRHIQRGTPFADIGDSAVNGGWPPHLHFQIISDLLNHQGEFPGVARPSQRHVWLSLSPDPCLILDLPALDNTAQEMNNLQILEERRQHLGQSLSIAYRRPLNIVRGFRQYLYDSDGQRYLDGVNNVCQVGHCHPYVVQALSRQATVLNTNTRYLHENLVRYARRLCATLPQPLTVCYFVCSGSEANELALRLARTHTSQRDIIVVDGAYHGNTEALIEISPYKFDGPGGLGPSANVHKIPMPDSFRGRYRRGYGDLGARYAKHIEEVIESLATQGRSIAAFICESLLSCGGQIVLPEDYLKAAFQHVRAAGGVCIVDEVQVGFGRVGTHFWGFQSQGVIPDIVTMGKPIGNGHPLAAVVTTPEIAASFANGMEYFNTFGGNPVSCAVGMAVMDVIEEEALQQHARDVGDYTKSRLVELQKKHPLVGDVRGLGLFIGVELVCDRQRLTPAPAQAKYVVERMRDHGILISTDGPDNNVLKIKPPLVFTRDNADLLVNTLDKILSESRLNWA